MFIIRFKQFFFIAQKVLQKQRYTLKNTANKKKFREYAVKIFKLMRDVDFILINNQFNEIYNEINYQFKKSFIGSFVNKYADFENFLMKLNEFKHFGWQKNQRIMQNQVDGKAMQVDKQALNIKNSDKTRKCEGFVNNQFFQISQVYQNQFSINNRDFGGKKYLNQSQQIIAKSSSQFQLLTGLNSEKESDSNN